MLSYKGVTIINTKFWYKIALGTKFLKWKTGKDENNQGK